MRYGPHNVQGYFGECFVRVLASAAGVIAGKQDIDTTGVDFTLELPGTRGTTRFPKIDVQVKSWSSPTGTPDAWHYSMDVAHFNDLAGTGFQVPRYLFLVVVPPDSGSFAEVDTEALRLRHCGYWASLANREPLDDGTQKSVTVHVPRSNVLTVPVLRALMSPSVPRPRVAP